MQVCSSLDHSRSRCNHTLSSVTVFKGNRCPWLLRHDNTLAHSRKKWFSRCNCKARKSTFPPYATRISRVISRNSHKFFGTAMMLQVNSKWRNSCRARPDASRGGGGGCCSCRKQPKKDKQRHTSHVPCTSKRILTKEQNPGMHCIMCAAKNT